MQHDMGDGVCLIKLNKKEILQFLDAKILYKYKSKKGKERKMSINSIQGFMPAKIQSLRISSDDCEKYGIKIEDFNKADKNEDGLIDANEFLSGGIGDLSIFNAFKGLATPIGAFSENPVDNNEQSMGVNFANKNQNQNFSLNHPNVSNPFQAQKCDYLA